MRLRLRATITCNDGCFQPGQIVDVTKETADQLLGRRQAEQLAATNAIPEYTPWPQDGCSLDEALRRTAEPSLWTAATEAEEKLKAAGGRDRRRRADASAIEGGSLRPAREEQDRHPLRRAADDAMGALTSRFYSFLAEGRLVATGADYSPARSPLPIPSVAWQCMQVRNWTKSIAVELAKEKREWYAIRIFPALSAPNVGGLIDNVPIGEVFKRFVIEDPEVKALAARALQTDHYAKPTFEEGKLRHGLSLEYYWPVEIRQLESFAKLIGDHRSHWESPVIVSNECEFAFAALRHRYRRMLELGRLIGLRGTVSSTGAALDIDPVQLVRPSAWLDIRNSDLLEQAANGSLVPRWLGLSFHVKPTGYDPVLPATKPVPVTRTGKALAKAELRKTSYDACIGWLTVIMQSSPSERTRSVQDLWSEAQQKWPGAVSERAFERARAKAILDSGATVWGLPGAPKNHRKRIAAQADNYGGY